MSKFELSDKELQQLLQNEGLEEPSLSFNRNVLEQTAAYEKAKTIKIPIYLKLLFGVLMLTPIVLILWNGGVNLGLTESLNIKAIDIPNPDLSFTLEGTYIYFFALTVGMIWLSIFFNKMLTDRKNSSVKNG